MGVSYHVLATRKLINNQHSKFWDSLCNMVIFCQLFWCANLRIVVHSPWATSHTSYPFHSLLPECSELYVLYAYIWGQRTTQNPRISTCTYTEKQSKTVKNRASTWASIHTTEKNLSKIICFLCAWGEVAHLSGEENWKRTFLSHPILQSMRNTQV